MVIKYASDAPVAAHMRQDRHPLAPAPVIQDLGEGMSALVARFVRRLRRRIVPMALMAAVPLAGAMAVIKLAAEQYQSTASVFIDPNGGRPGRADSPVDPGVMAMHVRLATSRSIFEKAMAKEKLAEDSSVFVKPTGSAALVNIMLSLLGKAPSGPVEDRKSAILRLMTEQVTARPSGEANLLEISATVPDAGTAARLANAVAQALVDDLVTMADSAQGSEQARLVTRSETLKNRLKDAEAKLALFRSQNGLEPAARNAVGGQDLAGQLARARTATIDARSKSDQIQKLLATGKDIEAIADLVRSPAIDRLRIQHNEAAAQEASFRSSLGPRHPSYLEAAEQARERRRLLLEGLRLAASSAKADWQAALAQEQALEKQVGPNAQAVVAQAPAPPAQLRELERDVEIARVAYDRQLRAMDGAASEGQSGIARIVVRATSSATALNGQSQQVWKLAGLASCGLALLVFLLGGRTGAGRSQPRRTMEFTPAPAADETAQGRPATVRKPASPAPVAVSALARPSTAAVQPETPPLDRLAVEMSARDSEFALQIVLVTGNAPAADRISVALELARAATRLDVRVLLIEANDAEPELTHRIAASPVAGLLNLNGRDRLVLSLAGDRQSQIWAVPSETERPVPANDGGLRRYGAIAGHFDLVVMTGPALDSGLAVRKLARVAQTVVVAAGADAASDKSTIARQLGIQSDAIRIMPASANAVAPDAASVARPMSVVRLQKCA